MDELIHDQIVDPREAKEHTDFITKVYGWMTFALFLSGMTSVWVAFTPSITSLIFDNRFIFYGLLILQLGMVLYLSFLVKKISAFNATLAFIGYSIVTGLTLSVIFLVYTVSSIIATFFYYRRCFWGDECVWIFYQKRPDNYRKSATDGFIGINYCFCCQSVLFQ